MDKLSPLAAVEIQLIMQNLCCNDLLHFAGCNRLLHQLASCSFVWKYASEVLISNKSLTLIQLCRRIKKLGVLSTPKISLLQRISLHVKFEGNVSVVKYNMKSLFETMVEFGSSRITCIELIDCKDTSTFISFLPLFSSITRLHLSSNNIYGNEAVSLAGAIKDNKSLTSINLNNNYLDDDGINALIPSLQTCPNLTSIDVSSNLFHSAGVVALASVFGHMKKIFLGDNYTSPIPLRELFAKIKESASLQTVCLEMTDLDEEELVIVSDIIKHHTSLTSINLGKNSMRDQNRAISALADAIANNKSLISLDLHGCQFGDKGMKVLAGALKSNQTLTNVNFSDCNINDHGITYISDVLKHNSVLKYIDLTINRFSKRSTLFFELISSELHGPNKKGRRIHW